ncbi:MAG: sugar hydrolase [Clostridia bacterium]|nr:sugar hydrolase [Clostridia bacterium]
MKFIHDENFAKKAKALQKPLKHETRHPKSIVRIERDETAFQSLRAVKVKDLAFPLTLYSGQSVVLDFGDHCVGYLHYALNHLPLHITDSPVSLEFTFGEFPYEIIKSPEEYIGELGNGWLQNETRNIVFTPYTGALERRYSFRYLKIERIDTAKFPILVADLYADCTSAVRLSDARKFDIPDATLEKIYDMSVKTLKECEQDVFEDGPKRDRRLWIGDLRLQALTDNVTFRNEDLVKRCIYLFSAYRSDTRFVAQCVFPDSSPYVYEWLFFDYSLFYISCVYDFVTEYDDLSFVKETYPMALEQAERVWVVFINQREELNASFIDWCKGLDKSVAMLGVFIYTMKQLVSLAKKIGEEYEFLEKRIEKVSETLLSHFFSEKGLFVTENGQISWHSQIWAVLANVLPKEKNVGILEKMKNSDLEFYPHTPYMMHYYLEALYSCGLKDEAIREIKSYWGKFVDYNFDCCPEIFNSSDHFESPYGAPEINSACHAWSCTPAYWIYRYYHE